MAAAARWTLAEDKLSFNLPHPILAGSVAAGTGQTGTDIGASIDLSGSRVMWLLGDTVQGLVGETRNQSLVARGFIKNGLLYQTGSYDLSAATVVSIIGPGNTAFFVPPLMPRPFPQTQECYPLAGIKVGTRVLVVAAQVFADTTAPFNTRVYRTVGFIGTDNGGAPDTWTWRPVEIQGEAGRHAHLLGAAGFVNDGNFIWAWSTDTWDGNGVGALAALPLDALETAWLTGKLAPRWLSNLTGALSAPLLNPEVDGRVLPRVPSVVHKDPMSAYAYRENIVRPPGLAADTVRGLAALPYGADRRNPFPLGIASQQPGNVVRLADGRYVFVYAPETLLSTDPRVRLSARANGADGVFATGAEVYDIPVTDIAGDFAYQPLGHVEQTWAGKGANDLLVTYSTNNINIGVTFNDSRSYQLKALQVTLI